MEFYKLSHFQLYSLLHSRHLDAENKEDALREFSRRQLSDDQVKQLEEELSKKTATTPFLFAGNANILLLLAALVLLFLLRQCAIR